MIVARNLRILLPALVLAAQPLSAQSLSHYREYTLESRLAAVVKTSGTAATEVKTVHERPAMIQELTWRAPYVSSDAAAADPVRSVLFGFYNDQLYRVVVTYEPRRVEGLTSADMIESISAAYGALPMPVKTGLAPPLHMGEDTTVVAAWDDGASVLTLVRGGHSRDFQLVLMSKHLTAAARTAMKDAIRMDLQEAPQRELARRNAAIADANVAREKSRTVNKAGFRP
jgi:hypothetical protein